MATPCAHSHLCPPALSPPGTIIVGIGSSGHNPLNCHSHREGRAEGCFHSRSSSAKETSPFHHATQRVLRISLLRNKKCCLLVLLCMSGWELPFATANTVSSSSVPASRLLEAAVYPADLSNAKTLCNLFLFKLASKSPLKLMCTSGFCFLAQPQEIHTRALDALKHLKRVKAAPSASLLWEKQQPCLETTFKVW